MDGEVRVDLARIAGHACAHQRVFLQQVAHQVRLVDRLFLQGPQVQAAQALARQCSQPVARHVVDGGLGLAHIVHAGLRHGLAEGPADEFRVQLPAQVKGAQIDEHMRGRRIGRGQVVVAQQGGHMGAAGLALGRVGEHHHVGDGQRRLHFLGGTRMDLVVQQHAQRVLG